MKKFISLIAMLLVFVCSVSFCLADTAPAVTQTPATESAETAPQQGAVETQQEAVPYVLKDVDINTELGKSIKKLYDAGVVNGVPENDGTFTYRAANHVTRAEFCKMINITFDYKVMAENIFTDVNPSQWYYIHVLPAIHYGYIKGRGDGTFGGTDNITREQVCVILDRIVNKKSDKEVVIADEVSDWAKDAVANMIGLGYMSLEDGGKFRAKENMTRGELAFALDDFAVIRTPVTDTNNTQNTTDKKEETDTSRLPTSGGSSGGSTSGGSSGGSSGGNTSGGNTSGGNTSGGNTSGGNTSGGNTSGGNTSGGNTSGGNTSGDNTSGGEEPTPSEPTYTISYVTDGGWVSSDGHKTSYKASDNDYTLPEASKSNHKFLGWFESEDADPASTEAIKVLPSGSTGSKTYYAKWAEYYKIKYELNFLPYGETLDESQIGRLDGNEKLKYTAYDEEYDLPIPERDDGMAFVGWYELQEFNNNTKAVIYSDEYRFDSIITGTEGDKHYQAVWEDMIEDSEVIYMEVDKAIIGLSDTLADEDEETKLNMPGDSLSVLTTSLAAMQDVITWKDQGILVHNRLVREVYKEDADIMRATIKAVDEAGEYDLFYNEITSKVPGYALTAIYSIFNIHDNFLD